MNIYIRGGFKGDFRGRFLGFPETSTITTLLKNSHKETIDSSYRLQYYYNLVRGRKPFPGSAPVSRINLQSEIACVSWISCVIYGDWQKKRSCAYQKMMVSSSPLLPSLPLVLVGAKDKLKHSHLRSVKYQIRR